MFVETSPTVANLFTRAEEGIAREDWKFTIDCLQRVIDNPLGSLVARQEGLEEGGVLYESARRRAVRQLASLPPEGLSAYRLLFDGRAKRLFERGRAGHNPADLWQVVHRYMLTRYGDDAADLLASWALDDGRPNQAVMLITDLLALIPDPDVPKELTAAKLAVAYALLGNTERAWTVMAVGDSGDTPSVVLEKLGEALPGRLDAVRIDPFAAWPVVGGSSSRRGLMPPVQPTMVASIPWRYDIVDALPDGWRRVYSDDPEGPLILPAVRPVATEDSLFMRTRRGCVALNRDDLVRRWRSGVPGAIGLPVTRSPVTGVPPPVPRRHTTDAGVAFEDDLVAQISFGHGLVTIVSREGTGNYTQGDRDKGSMQGLQWFASPAVGRRSPQGTQIVAYDSQTGRVRWQRGRTNHPDDPLQDVEFRSAPLYVSGFFWVPYFRQSDFYVAVLDPADGALIENVLLCSIAGSQGPAISAFQTLPPAASDGLVFIPSGHGILFALDVHDYTLRWASLYQSSLSRESLAGLSGPNRWLPGPPVVSGEVVLLGAKEKSALLAFSTATGELQWSAQPTGAAYIIAADNERVWIGGRSISCLLLSGGEVLWTVVVPSPSTGRAVLAGDIVHVPLLDGLLSLGAGSGEALEYASLPANEDPLGNLLSLDHAVLITGPSGIRKFPDIDRSFPIAQAQYDMDPTNVASAVRLAWLKLMRGNPLEALEVLEEIDPSALNADMNRAEETVRLRVEALLSVAQLAKSRGGSDDEALHMLTRAGEIAQSPADRLRCGLAIAHQLTTMGRGADAYRRLWALGIGSTGRQVVSVNDHVKGMARVDIARRLAEIGTRLSPSERRNLTETVAEKIAELIEKLREGSDPREVGRQLHAIADMDAIGPARNRAFSAIAAYEADLGKFERAEQLLRESVRSTSDPARVVSGLVELCELYSKAGDLGIPYTTALLGGLRELESRFPDFSVAPQDRVDHSSHDSATASNLTVSEWVNRRRSELFAQHGHTVRLDANHPFELTGEQGWSVVAPDRTPSARIVRVDESGSPTMTDRTILFGIHDEVACYSAGSGELLWKTELRLPETFSNFATPSVNVGESGARRAVADGQTVVFRSNQGLFGVGLATGRRLWVRAFDATALVDPIANPDMRMAAGDGLLAAMPNGGRLSLMRMLDGTTVWERDLRGESVEFVSMYRNRVVTVDHLMQRVHVFDRTSGRLIERVLFDQPDPDRQVISLVESGGVLCGPASPSKSEGIQGMDVLTGEVIWRMDVDKPVARLFKPHEGYLGIGLLGGDVRILDAKSGELLVEHRVPGAHVVVDGLLVDGTLLVRHQASRDSKHKNAVSALDLATGEEIWNRDDLITLSSFDGSLPVFGGRLLGAVSIKTTGRKRRQELKFSSVDVRTGKSIGPETSIIRENDSIVLNGDLIVYPLAGVVVFGTEKVIRTLRLAPSREEGKEGL